MKKGFVFVLAVFSLAAIIFYYLDTGREITALFRGAGIAGFTFLAFSLLITPLAMFFPQLSRFVAFRTEAGVFGAFLIVFHAAILFLTNSHINTYLLAAGSIALLIYLMMMLTSGVRNMKKIGFEKWKMVHRLAYIALPLAAYHAIMNYPKAFKEPFGLIMVVMIGLAVIFQVAGFVKRKMK